MIANIQFVKCLTLFIGPALMKVFVQDETAREQWRSIFILFAIVLFIVSLSDSQLAMISIAQILSILNI